MKDFFPILKSLKKQKIAPILLALQVAITFMVLVNTAYMIGERSKKMQRPTGLDEANTFYVITNILREGHQVLAEHNDNLRQIRALDGVVAAAPLPSIPLIGWGRYTDFYLDPKGESVAYGGYFNSDEHALKALNLELIAGEWFTPTDIVSVMSDGTFVESPVVVTQALAEKIYPNNWRDIVDTTLYFSGNPHRVKGVIKTLQSSWQFWSMVELTVLAGVNEALPTSASHIAIRTQPGRLEEVMNNTVDMLLKTPGRKIERIGTMAQVRQKAYKEDLATSKILTAIGVGLAIITGLGIFGQARYNVSRRTQQIGTRRALGANKWDVIRYFMVENAVVTSIGVVIGLLGAIILNNQFVELLSINPVPLSYLMIGTVMIFVLGQLAVIYPATRASRVSPAIATRGA
ncbi:ABC transporter permease [Pseudoalteromonas sp. T1lg23B]|uniref:ABC transporter permease n=1 Tax=Pseudoalteromonas sp. T1lg23B TaxID=2077097 RepID=UPI000CF70D03|nr:FtsX-like permease family protein [Pseudoalteromonas sp. T1lg23B]